ncbi:MAG: hypothetical protein RR198_01210 [Oscillospiraceae bacterium]
MSYEGDEHAIGYVSMGSVNDEIFALQRLFGKGKDHSISPWSL